MKIYQLLDRQTIADLEDYRGALFFLSRTPSSPRPATKVIAKSPTERSAPGLVDPLRATQKRFARKDWEHEVMEKRWVSEIFFYKQSSKWRNSLGHQTPQPSSAMTKSGQSNAGDEAQQQQQGTQQSPGQATQQKSPRVRRVEHCRWPKYKSFG